MTQPQSLAGLWHWPQPQLDTLTLDSAPVADGFPGSSVGKKNPPAMQETQVQSLGGEDPLEKEIATHSSILAGKIPWTEKPGRLQSMGSQRVGHD